MQLKTLFPLAIAQLAASQSLADVLGANNDTLSTLGALLAGQPELVEALSAATDITILAPSDEAFSAFLNTTMGNTTAQDPAAVAALLTYHVINGTFFASNFTDAEKPLFAPTLLSDEMYANVTGGQRVKSMVMDGNVHIFSGLGENSTVVTPNVNFTGGVIHVIDKVLTIPQSDSATAVAAGLSALAGALTSADLVSTVDGLEDVTIFAPSNEAFNAIGAAVANLTTEQLSSILTYHVVQGAVGYSSDLVDGAQFPTVGGGNITITIADGNVFVNSAKVVVADVLVANGVVHVIDNVLNPGNATAKPDTTASMQPPAFTATGTGSAGVPFTSGVMVPTSTAPVASGVSSSATGAGMPMKTAAVGAAALFGGAAMLANF